MPTAPPRVGDAGEPPPAIVLAGPRGSGKTTFANRLVRAFLAAPASSSTPTPAPAVEVATRETVTRLAPEPRSLSPLNLTADRRAAQEWGEACATAEGRRALFETQSQDARDLLPLALALTTRVRAAPTPRADDPASSRGFRARITVTYASETELADLLNRARVAHGLAPGPAPPRGNDDDEKKGAAASPRKNKNKNAREKMVKKPALRRGRAPADPADPEPPCASSSSGTAPAEDAKKPEELPKNSNAHPKLPNVHPNANSKLLRPAERARVAAILGVHDLDDPARLAEALARPASSNQPYLSSRFRDLLGAERVIEVYAAADADGSRSHNSAATDGVSASAVDAVVAETRSTLFRVAGRGPHSRWGCAVGQVLVEVPMEAPADIVDVPGTMSSRSAGAAAATTCLTTMTTSPTTTYPATTTPRSLLSSPSALLEKAALTRALSCSPLDVLLVVLDEAWSAGPPLEFRAAMRDSRCLDRFAAAEDGGTLAVAWPLDRIRSARRGRKLAAAAGSVGGEPTAWDPRAFASEMIRRASRPPERRGPDASETPLAERSENSPLATEKRPGPDAAAAPRLSWLALLHAAADRNGGEMCGAHARRPVFSFFGDVLDDRGGGAGRGDSGPKIPGLRRDEGPPNDFADVLAYLRARREEAAELRAPPPEEASVVETSPLRTGAEDEHGGERAREPPPKRDAPEAREEASEPPGKPEAQAAPSEAPSAPERDELARRVDVFSGPYACPSSDTAGSLPPAQARAASPPRPPPCV